jgi:hypothetical protein
MDDMDELQPSSCEEDLAPTLAFIIIFSWNESICLIIFALWELGATSKCFKGTLLKNKNQKTKEKPIKWGWAMMHSRVGPLKWLELQKP